MQQVKLFRSIESDLAALERDVNRWIKDNHIRVLSITGNIAPQSSSLTQPETIGGSQFAPSDVLLILTYEQ